jgi:hypothetical protein
MQNIYLINSVPQRLFPEWQFLSQAGQIENGHKNSFLFTEEWAVSFSASHSWTINVFLFKR